MKVGQVLRDLHGAENDLTHGLLRLSDHHRVDHEIYHLARDLAGWSQQHLVVIARVAQRYGQDLEPEPEHEPGSAARLRSAVGLAVGRNDAPGLVLLRDLRDVYLQAAGVYTDWEMVAQAAQALKDAGLVSLAETCMAQTKRQMAWANGKLKESSSQVLLS
ncbi:MAG TPA: hypothetical protein VGK35_08155 [Actinotalea sp.]